MELQAPTHRLLRQDDLVTTPPPVRSDISIRNIVDSQASLAAGHVKHFLNEWTNISEILTFYSAYLVALLNSIRSHCACQCLYA